MFSTKKILMSAAAAALMFTGASAAHAQQHNGASAAQGQAQAQAQAQPQAAQQNYEVTDQKLEQFVEAQQAAGAVQKKYQEQAQDISSQEEMNSLQQEMNGELVQAVKDTGLSVQEYNMIMAALQNDPEMQEKYTNMVR